MQQHKAIFPLPLLALIFFRTEPPNRGQVQVVYLEVIWGNTGDEVGKWNNEGEATKSPAGAQSFS